MPIHWNIDPARLEDEIILLKSANKKITHIIPAAIEHKPGNIFGIVMRYAIVFEDKYE